MGNFNLGWGGGGVRRCLSCGVAGYITLPFNCVMVGLAHLFTRLYASTIPSKASLAAMARA